ncbi:hypothetical protein [Thalassotalea sp. ND16A]|uniref:hypothetical protein n=1 Tax=Thalassotalea sp. ND16A TaxID=1535422 RepID=UPI00051A20A1|nr:hypothetical protein [Thalassotalea sp. ND16A]KGJ90256.1 hypothetical protein ND16A_1986 [Thalassotalea sp. ND16A]
MAAEKIKQVTFIIWLKKQLGIADATPQVLVLVGILCFLIVFILSIITFSVFKKLDDNTKYLITAESEHISYQTTKVLPPPIIIKNFKYAQECGDFSKETYSEGELDVNRNYLLKITRMLNNEVTIVLVKAPKNVNEKEQNKKNIKGYFEIEGEGVEYNNCLAIKVQLNEENPVLEFNAIGHVELGKSITDASDGYYPLLLSGEITVTGETLFFQSTYQFTPYVIKKSDYIYNNSVKDSSQTAIIRVVKDEPGMTAIVSLHGGNLYVQRYRMEPQLIESSFIDRVSNDYELAFSLSIAIVFVQFLFGVINFLLRIEMIHK